MDRAVKLIASIIVLILVIVITALMLSRIGAVSASPVAEPEKAYTYIGTVDVQGSEVSTVNAVVDATDG